MIDSLPLRRLSVREHQPSDVYPFTVPAIAALTTLSFTAPVTFFVGENGAGKSTLLEAVACAAQLPTVGETPAHRDATLRGAQTLAQALRWEWSGRQRRGFFMRSEDFFGYVKRMERTRQELEEDMRVADAASAHRGTAAQALSRMAYAGQLHALRQSYGDGLDARSHGESFLHLFRSRFVDNGLYLLDEPEAPLSPVRQLALIALMHEMVARGGQFIIATHSPMLLAYPGATLYLFGDGAPRAVAYDTLEHVTLTRDFLNDPQRFLAHLLDNPC